MNASMRAGYADGLRVVAKWYRAQAGDGVTGEQRQFVGAADWITELADCLSGFTREDVAMLHRIAEAASGDGVSDPIEFIDTMLVVGDGARLRSLMSRIEALLPPG